MPVVLNETYELLLQTRRRNHIPNELTHMEVWGDNLVVEEYKNKYPSGEHRPVGPSRKYNCHGLTFACRRTSIDDPKDVLMILTEDDYQEVQLNNVIRGDIAVYFVGGIPEHSGIVVEVNKPRLLDEFAITVPLILSKWGRVQEVIHKPRECPGVEGAEIKYFRIIR